MKFGEKVLQKGYDGTCINKELEIVKTMERKELLVTKDKAGGTRNEGGEFGIV